MRSSIDSKKLDEVIAAFGRAAKGPGRIYLVGGCSAVALQTRESTIDVDIKLAPEPAGIFEAIAAIKERLDVNIELASPDQFIPEVPGWENRSSFITRSGTVDFYHYDLYSQTLAKLERWHTRDRLDVAAWLAAALIERAKLRELFRLIEPKLIRFPSIDIAFFKARVEDICNAD